MKSRLFRILTIVLSFFFLTGFIPILSFVGPGVTALTSGNVYKASAQFIVNQHIEKETGKNSFALIKDTLLSEETDKTIKSIYQVKCIQSLCRRKVKMFLEYVRN